jgi:excisionase family DNA binding protein
VPKGAWQRPSRKEFEDRGWLHDQYVRQGKTAQEIADLLGVSKPTALRWLRHHGIPLRPGRRPSRFSAADHADIAGRYQDGASLSELADAFETSMTTVCDVLDRCGVARRPSGKHNKPKQSKAWPTLMQDGWLEREYTEERKSISVIAGQLGCSMITVRRALEEKQVPIRWGSAAKRGPTKARKLTHRHSLQIRKQFPACALCARSEDLEVHHRDGDRTNDNPENLVVLCRDCHAIAEWFIRPVEMRLRGAGLLSLPV